MATQQTNDKKTGVKRSGVKSTAAKTSSVKSASVRAASAKAAPRRKSAAEPARPQQDADSPILPIDQLERLHDIKPDAVDWVIQQTQVEAEHRREETSRVNGFILLEHLLGMFSALLIGASGILGGSWVAINGQPWAGVVIVVSVITALTVVYLKGRTKA